MEKVILILWVLLVQCSTFFIRSASAGCSSTEVPDWSYYMANYDDPSTEEIEEYSTEEEIFKPTKTISIDCVFVTTENFNFTYESKKYKHSEATIELSTIPVLKPNFLDSFIDVRRLTLEHIGIEELQPGLFDGFNNLRQINLNRNKIKAIPKGIFNPLQSLRVLSISGNEIVEIDAEAFQGMTKVKTIFINSNKIMILKENLFRDLTNLNYVDVSNNPLEELRNVNFTNFEALIMKNTDLKTINANFSHLSTTKLDWHQNKFEVIDFSSLPKTLLIILDNNRINKLQNFNRVNATLLDLSYNNLSSLPDLPENVTELRLNRNKIVSLENSTKLNKSIEILKLQDNFISNITRGPFYGLVNLTLLDLSHNLITTIDSDSFKDMKKLEDLLLSNNFLTKIQPGTFDGLENLETLDISHNKMEELESVLFATMKKLSSLDISSNRITIFDVSHLKRSSDSLGIRLNNNLFLCGDLPSILYHLYVHHIVVRDAGSSDGPDNINGVSCVHKHAKR